MGKVAVCTASFLTILHSHSDTFPDFRGAEGRARTGDPFLFREMLYQLSYLGNFIHYFQAEKPPHPQACEATVSLYPCLLQPLP